MQRLALPEREPLIGSTVREAEAEFEIFAQGSDLLNLTYADTKRFPAPAWAVEDFTAAARGGGKTYTPYRGDIQVRETVASAVGHFLGVPVDPSSEIALTPGTQAGLFHALAATIEEGDRVLLIDPDYLCLERILRFLGADVVHIPLAWDRHRLTLDLDQIQRALRSGARMLVLSHPNNPTGAVYDHVSMNRLAKLLVEHDAHVLVDELYSRLVYDGAEFPHLVARQGMKDRCVTLLGPSKTESMSGYRIGVLVGPAPVVSAVEDIQSVTTIRAPAYSQQVLRRWLKEDQDFVSSRVSEYQALRDQTMRHLMEVDFVKVANPGGTAYVFPDVSALGISDLQISQELLTGAQVIINPGFQFGPRGIGSFRICFAQDAQALDRALTRICVVLQRLAKSAA